ncbi:hypothetical protein CDL15_Pgr014765 [Punica granatum]|uniref:Uncharacterized protein n=2 Tax=Punica granatum TaxID=22663 RepID=A0A218Y1P7_PUNGR|nr:hypothetical protein CDL15_Pgr014765 [Punica granatum]
MLGPAHQAHERIFITCHLLIRGAHVYKESPAMNTWMILIGPNAEEAVGPVSLEPRPTDNERGSPRKGKTGPGRRRAKEDETLLKLPLALRSPAESVRRAPSCSREVPRKKMDESAKLSALKKAYAEIIMNVSKEAACRVMASEKKRLRLDQELSEVKDEGLHLLLRLKKMLDDKTNEAEAISINQRKRIDELEAQLDEAKDIEKELRGELREAHAELAKVTSYRLGSSNRTCTGPGTASGEPIVGNDLEASKRYSHNTHFYAHNLDFSARVMGYEETELYHNSFTQKIQAFGGKLCGHMSLPGKDDHLANGLQGKNETLCLIPKLSPDQPFGMEEDSDEHEVTETHGKSSHFEVPKSFHIKRKRTTRYQKGKIPLPVVVQRASNIYCSESSLESHHARRLALDTEQMGMQSERPIISSHVELVRPCSFWDTRDDSKLLKEAALTRREKGPMEALTFSSGRSDVGRVNDLTSHVDVSNLADPVLEDRRNGKFLKYTFQRRRKKGQFCDGNSTVDQITPKMEIDDDCNGFRESDLVDLVSSGDTQLIEVAEQLVTLSQKK